MGRYSLAAIMALEDSSDMHSDIFAVELELHLYLTERS
jgi:hypothetical protein